MSSPLLPAIGGSGGGGGFGGEVEEETLPVFGDKGKGGKFGGGGKKRSAAELPKADFPVEAKRWRWATSLFGRGGEGAEMGEEWSQGRVVLSGLFG